MQVLTLTAVTHVSNRRRREEKDAFAEQRELPQDQHLMPKELHEVCETATRMSDLSP